MTEQALLLVNLGSPASTEVADAPLPQPVPDGPVRGRSAAAAPPAGLDDPDQAARAVRTCLCLDLVAGRVAAGGAQPPTAGGGETALDKGPGGTGDALRRAVDRRGAEAPGRAGHHPGGPRTALSAVCRQHHDDRHPGSAPGHPRARAGSQAIDPAALLRSAGISRRAGGQRHAAPAAGLRSSAAELPWAAGAAPAQVRSYRCALPEG